MPKVKVIIRRTRIVAETTTYDTEVADHAAAFLTAPERMALWAAQAAPFLTDWEQEAPKANYEIMSAEIDGEPVIRG